MKRYVVVKFAIEGVHCWPGCPFDDVAFLRDKHRHMFHVGVAALVTHGDRQVEIIRLKRDLQRWMVKSYPRYEGSCLDLGTDSCEQLAEKLITEFDLAWCKVYEDDENGAIVMGDE